MQSTTMWLFVLAGVMSLHRANARRGLAAAQLGEYLLSLPENEIHHICLTGNRAQTLMESFIMIEGHKLSPFEMKSSLNPDTKCEVKDYKVGNALFLVTQDISETCAARWKVHSSSCDVLVHAHEGKECDILYKFRLITDQCDAPLVVIHSDSAFMRCYNDKVNLARAKDMMPLHEECTRATHSVLLEKDGGKSNEVVPVLRTALQQASPLVKNRYAHLVGSTLQQTNSTHEFRQLLQRGKRSTNDLTMELLRVMQDVPVDRGARSVLQKHLKVKTKSKKRVLEHNPSVIGAHESAALIVDSDEVSLGRHRTHGNRLGSFSEESVRSFNSSGVTVGEGGNEGFEGFGGGMGGDDTDPLEGAVDNRVEETEASCSGNVVIDNGSGSVKIGCGDQASEPTIIDSLVGMPKYPYILPEGWKPQNATDEFPEQRELPLPGEVFSEKVKPAVGHKKEWEMYRGLTKIEYPIVHGIIQDIKQMKVVWEYALSKVNIKAGDNPSTPCDSCTASSGVNFLLTDVPLNPKTNRERIVDAFLKDYSATGVFIVEAAVVALFGAGQTTGLVVDIGDGVTHIAPIVEGYALPHAVKRMDMAGRDLTWYMARMLTEEELNRGRFFATSAELEIARYIKEMKGNYVAFDPNDDGKTSGPDAFTRELEKFKAEKEASDRGEGDRGSIGWWSMPDGQVLMITTQQFRVAEPLFKPEMVGVESAGIPALIVDSVSMCDIDIRKKLYKNMILSGGTCLFRNLKERIEQEIFNDKRVSLEREEVSFIEQEKGGPKDPRNLAYKGGLSIINMNEVMEKLWYKKSDYDGEGAGGHWAQEYTGLRPAENSRQVGEGGELPPRDADDE